MESTSQEKSPVLEERSLVNLGRVFKKRSTNPQYLELLQYFLTEDGQSCPQKPHAPLVRQPKPKLYRGAENIRSRLSLIKSPTTKRQSVQSLQPPKKHPESKVISPLLPSLKSPRLSNSKRTSHCKPLLQPKKCGVYSHKGRLLAPNKHSILVSDQVYVLCDGNGDKGHLVSSFISQFLLKSTTFLFSLEEWKKFSSSDAPKLQLHIQEMFATANDELSNSGINVETSGCMATLVYLGEEWVVTVNLGDSNILMVNTSDMKYLIQDNTPKLTVLKHNPEPSIAHSFGNSSLGLSCCNPSVTISPIPKQSYLLIGSYSFFSNLEIPVIYDSINGSSHPLESLPRDLVEKACKSLKTISHEDVSCIVVPIFH